MKILVFVVMTYSLTAICYAKDNYYFGVGTAAIVLDSTSFTAPGMDLTAFAGYQFSNHFIVEIQYTTVSKLEDGSTIQPTFFSGSMLRHFSLNEQLALYYRVGAVYWETDIRLGQNRTISKSGSDITLGAGFELQLNEKINIRQDLQYFSVDDGKAAHLGFSIVYQF